MCLHVKIPNFVSLRSRQWIWHFIFVNIHCIAVYIFCSVLFCSFCCILLHETWTVKITPLLSTQWLIMRQNSCYMITQKHNIFPSDTHDTTYQRFETMGPLVKIAQVSLNAK